MSDETKLNKRKRDTLAILDEYIIFRKLEKDYRKKKALTRCLYSLVASFYNDLSSVQWEQWRSLELIQIFRKYVLLNLFKDKHFTSILRKIVFLVSPKLLKSAGYHL